MAEDIKNSLEKRFLTAYDEFAEKLLRHIYFRVSQKSLAEDLLSETFMKTWQYLRLDHEIKNLKSFLYKVADNLIIDHYRRRHDRTTSLEEIGEVPIEEGLSLAEQGDLTLTLRLVKSHLDSLPADHKRIIIYRYIDELGIQEIKELTGKSTANIYTIIHRGLKALRNKLKQENEKG